MGFIFEDLTQCLITSQIMYLSLILCAGLANNSIPSCAVNIQCFITQSNEIIERCGTYTFCLLHFVLFGMKIHKKNGCHTQSQVVFN